MDSSRKQRLQKQLKQVFGFHFNVRSHWAAELLNTDNICFVSVIGFNRVAFLNDDTVGFRNIAGFVVDVEYSPGVSKVYNACCIESDIRLLLLEPDSCERDFKLVADEWNLTITVVVIVIHVAVHMRYLRVSSDWGEISDLPILYQMRRNKASARLRKFIRLTMLYRMRQKSSSTKLLILRCKAQDVA